MPKMKSRRAAVKRFKKTATGKIKHFRANKSHLNEWKPANRKRRLRRAAIVSKGDAKRIKQLITYL